MDESEIREIVHGVVEREIVMNPDLDPEALRRLEDALVQKFTHWVAQIKSVVVDEYEDYEDDDEEVELAIQRRRDARQFYGSHSLKELRKLATEAGVKWSLNDTKSNIIDRLMNDEEVEADESALVSAPNFKRASFWVSK